MPIAIHWMPISTVKMMVRMMSVMKNTLYALEPSAGHDGVSIASMMDDQRMQKRMKLPNRESSAICIQIVFSVDG